jgi:hypothetical protein
MKPIRIQRKRTKGWRMPDNTIYVGRPTRWGNPFPTHELPRDGHGDIIYGELVQVRTAAQAVKLFADMLVPYRHHGKRSELGDFYLSTCNMETIKYELAGKNLCCWCPLDQPCHADVLLEIANG